MPALPVVDVEARNRMVEKNLGLVIKVATGFRKSGIDMDDLIQYGNLGLIRAAEKFEPERGFRFSTYAVIWIRQAIHRGLEAQSYPICIAAGAYREGREVVSFLDAVEARTGVRPMPSEAIDAMHAGAATTAATKERLRLAARAVACGRDGVPVELFDGASPSPLAGLIDQEHREQLALALELLREEDRRVLVWRYGLDGRISLTPRQVAAILGKPRRLVERVEREAIERLRFYLRRQVS